MCIMIYFTSEIIILNWNIWKYLCRWAVAQCKLRKVKSIGRGKRQFMEPLLKHIRFTTMKLEEIQEVIGPARVLEPREILAIMSHLTGPEHLKLPVPYKTTPRRIPFSKQPEFLPPASSVDGMFSELILDYAEDGIEGPPCMTSSKKSLTKIRSAKK